MLKKLLITLVFTFSLLLFVPSAHASTLYLSPGSANIPQGSVVSVAVGINTAGESINGISAYLSYPQDKLEVAWITYGGSFAIAAEGAYGGGGIRISRGSISGVVGSVNVATIGFRGKSQGTATVTFIGGSGAPRTSDSSDSLNLGGSTGGTFTVTAPVSGGQTGTAAPIAPSSAKDQKAPNISNVQVSLISTTSATISWTTDEKADSTIEYGLFKDRYILSENNKNLLTDHSIVLQGAALTPGALMHFRVKSNDAAGNEGVGNDLTVQLKGYTVSIKVFDIYSKPVRDTQIFLYTNPLRSKTSLTGEAVFTDVTPGKHLVVVKLSNNLDKTGEIDVQDFPLAQTFTLAVNTKLSETGYLYLGLAVMGLIGMAVLVITIIVLLKRKQKSPTSNPKQPV